MAAVVLCAGPWGASLAAGWGQAPLIAALPQAAGHQEGGLLLAMSSRMRAVARPAAAEPQFIAVVSGPQPTLRLAATLAGRVAQSGAAVAVPAQQPAAPTSVIDLAQAYRLALENDATLRAARAAAAARAERLPQAKSQLRPQVTASASRFRNDLTTTSPGLDGAPVETRQRYASSTQTLSVRQALFRPLFKADVRQAEAQVAEAAATLEREVQTMAVRVVSAYLATLSAREQHTLVVAQKRAFAAQVESARRRFDGGSGIRTDIDEAQARLDMAVAQELEALQNLDFNRRQLQTLLNVPVGEIAALDAARLPLTEPQPPLVGSWTARAEESSPEIRAARAAVEAARQDVEKARAGHLPTVDALAQWSVSDSDNVTRVNSRYDQKSIGVQLNLPLYSGGLVSSQVRQALAEQERVQELLEALRRDLGLRVHKEFRGVSEGVLRVRALEQAVRSASTVVESTRRSYAAGGRTLTDILNAEEQLATATRDLADARHLYLLSRLRLRALAGEADQSVMDEANGWLKR